MSSIYIDIPGNGGAVQSINGLSGAVTIVGDTTNIAVTTSGDIAISATNIVKKSAIASATGIAVTPATNLTVAGKYFRDGQVLQLDGQILWNGTPDSGTLIVDISGMPGSPVIDTSSLVGGSNTSNELASLLGYGQLFSAGVAWFEFNPYFVTTTTFQFRGGSAPLDASTPGSGSALNFTISVPIVGWS